LEEKTKHIKYKIDFRTFFFIITISFNWLFVF